MKKLLLILTITVAITLSSAATRAHHVVSDSGIAWVEPLTVVEVDARSASFDFGERWRGRWLKLTPSVEAALGRRFSLGLRAPIAVIQFDDGRGVLGLGDVEASAKALLYSSEHGGLIVSAGLGTELPTGVVEDALGSGHVELTPYITASTQPSARWIISGLASDRFAPALFSDEEEREYTEPEDIGPHGSVLSPHSNHELFLRATVTHLFGANLYWTAGVDHIWVYSQHQRGESIARTELGWARAREWRVSLGADAPFRGTRRSGPSVRLSWARMFGR